jgi:hypothetical protein
MAVVTTCKKQGSTEDTRYQIWYVALDTTDTEIVINTGLGRILHHEISPPSVGGKYVTTQAVSGGKITYTVTDPGEAEYFYVYVESDF